MDVLEYVNQVKKGEIDVADSVKNILEEAKKINKNYNYFNVISEELALEQVKNFNNKGILAGLPISVKDNICVKDVESTAGSKVLKGYKPTFNAFAVQRIILLSRNNRPAAVLKLLNLLTCIIILRRKRVFPVYRKHIYLQRMDFMFRQ